MSQSLEANGFDSNDSENDAESDSITVEDRNGDTHEFANFPNRLAGGEMYAESHALYDKNGERMGNTEPVSTIYKQGTENFPNTYIGQSNDNPGGSWEDATSPLAFLYSRYAARGPKETAKERFYQEVEEETDLDPSDVTIEDYKANYPVRKALWMDNTDMVRIGKSPIESRQHKPWEDYYLPAEWVEAFGEEIPVWKNEDSREGGDEQQEDEDMSRSNYENIGGEEEEESVSDELEEQIREVDTSELNKKESAAAIAAEVPEVRGSLPDELRELLMEVTDASKTTVYKGQELFTESGDPREEEEESADEQTETETETVTEDNNTEEVGNGTKVLNLAVEHKPEEVFNLLVEENPELVYSNAVDQFEEELEEEFGGEDKSEEEMVDDLFSGL